MKANFARLNGLAVLTLAMAATSGVAAAQPVLDPRDDQNVRARHQTEYDPVGIPMGGFRLYPRITGNVESNDNVFARPDTPADPATSDTAYVVGAQARLASQWSQHELAFEASVEDTSYADLDSENDTAWSVGGQFAIDVSRATRLSGTASYADTFEPRGINDPIDLAEPINFTETRASLQLSQEFNRLRVTVGATSSEIDYEDGTLIAGPPGGFDQDFRDRTQTEVTGRGDLALSPDTALFLSVSERWNDYDTGNRDYDRTRALFGGTFDVTNLVRGEIGVGYSWTSFDNPAFTDFDGFSMRGAVDWFITRITTVNLAAERDVADSGDPTASTKVVSDAGIRVDHELYRNIIFWVRAGWAQEDYKGLDRKDDTNSQAIGCDWLVNRWAAVRARFMRTEHDFSGTASPLGRDYEQNRATLGITLRR